MKITQEQLVKMINESIKKHISLIKEDYDDANGISLDTDGADGTFFNPQANKEKLEEFAEQVGKEFFANLPQNGQFESDEDIAKGLIYVGAFAQKPQDFRIYTTKGECFQWGDKITMPSVRDGIIKIYDGRDADKVKPQYIEPISDSVNDVTSLEEIIDSVQYLREETAYYFNEDEDEEQQEIPEVVELFGTGDNKVEIPTSDLKQDEIITIMNANKFSTRGATADSCAKYATDTRKKIVDILKNLLVSGKINREQYDNLRYHYYQDKGAAASRTYKKLIGR